MAVVDPRGRGSGGTEDGATTGKKIVENKVPLRMLLLMHAPRNSSRSCRVRRWGAGTREEKLIRNLLLRQAEEQAYKVEAKLLGQQLTEERERFQTAEAGAGVIRCMRRFCAE